MNYNYPLRVLKNKFRSKKYVPFILDSRTGETIKTTHRARTLIVAGLALIVSLVVAVMLFNYIIIQPISNVSAAKFSVEQTLNSISGGDRKAVNKIVDAGNLVSSEHDNGFTTVVVSYNDADITKYIEASLKLSSVREVNIDGKTISITYVSSK